LRSVASFRERFLCLSAFIDDFARPSGILRPLDLRLLSWLAAI